MPNPKKAVLWSSLLVIILALPGIALVIPRLRTKASSPAKQASAKEKRLETAARTSANAKVRVEGEIVAVRPTGFEPKEITRPTGPFLLIIDNYSGLPMATFLLNSDVGLPLRNVLVPRETRIWSEIVDLPPGTYTLREATHPSWICQITIH